jgi:hypothetical protein
MQQCFILYGAAMTTAIFAIAVYSFTKDMPSTGFTLMVMSLFSLLWTIYLIGQYTTQLARIEAIRQMSRIEVVVVPSLVVGDKTYPMGVPVRPPLANPLRQCAQ